MKSLHVAVLTMLTALAAIPGCADPETGSDITDDSDLTKRTKPKAGMGGVVLEKPAWLNDGFKGEVKVGNATNAQTLTPDTLVDLVPGSYEVFFRPEGIATSLTTSDGTWGVFGHLWRQSGSLAAGQVWKVSPAGLRIELDRPLVFKRNVLLATAAVPSPGIVKLSDQRFSRVLDHTTAGPFYANYEYDRLSLSSEEIAAGAKTLDRIFPAETYSLTLIGQAKTSVALTAGNLTTVTMKTLKYAVDLDPIDPAYPNAAAQCVTIEADSVREPVRALDAFATAVLPEGYPVKVKAFGIEVPGKITGDVKHFTLNRLELADVEVSAPGGGTTMARGSARVEVKSAAGWASLDCLGTISTGTGIDLPDGTYRITSTATGPNGLVTSTEEISFP